MYGFKFDLLKRERPAAGSAVFVAMALSLAVSGCIQSRCYQHKDCPAGNVCLTETGKCVVPECTGGQPCSEGYYCQDYFCVKGCLKNTECEAGEKCIEARCMPYSEQCDCLGAPEFCEQDLNPASQTSGQEVCVSHFSEGGLAIFFGSVKCSHCRNIFDEVIGLKTDLAIKGYDPSLMFMQIQDPQIVSDDITSLMGGVKEPVLNDSEALGVWDAYMADWYHLVFVDRFGCKVAHFGPLEAGFTETEVGVEISDAWVQSLTAECTPSTAEPMADGPGPDLEVVEAPEVPDLVRPRDLLEVVEPPPDAANLPDQLGPDQQVEPDSDTLGPYDVGDTLEETAVPDEMVFEDIVPFQLTDLCQIEESASLEIGDSVPYMLCKDLNPSSPTYEQGFSSWSMKETVWIAYFGSCG